MDGGWRSVFSVYRYDKYKKNTEWKLPKFGVLYNDDGTRYDYGDNTPVIDFEIALVFTFKI